MVPGINLKNINAGLIYEGRNAANEVFNGAKTSLWTGVKESAKFAFGLNNVSNAYQFSKGERTFIVKINSANEALLQPHDPSVVERVRNASGELTIAAAKVVGLAMFSHGAVCKGGEALGYMEPCNWLSLSGLNQAVFTGVTTSASIAVKTGVFLTENVAIPVATFTFDKILNNPVNAIALGATGFAMYSAVEDISAMSKPANIQIKNNKIVVDMSSAPTWAGKVKLGLFATAKIATAGAIVAAAMVHNGF